MERGGISSATARVSAYVSFAFLLFPSLIIVPISFSDTNEIVFPPPGYSFRLFRQFFFGEGWVPATILSTKIALLSTAIVVVMGVPAAYAISRGTFRGQRLASLFLLSPIMVPGVVLALGLYVGYLRLGVSDGFTRLLAAHCMITLPFIIVTATAGLRNIDPDLERAATIMGAGRLTVLRYVTIPLLMPSIISGALFAFLISFDEFIISYFVSTATSRTLPIKMFSSIQFEISPVLAAISTMLLFLSVAVCLAVWFVQREGPAS